MAYSNDFTKFGWLDLLARCNDLNNQYNTTVKKMFYVHSNNLGSTVALTDQSGSVVQEYEYDVYGNTYVKSGSGFVNIKDFVGNLHGNDRLFTGREYDREIGLYYLRARYYSSEMGRFISRDPIGTSDDVNLYGYVGENPVGFVDLMGLEKTLIIGFTGKKESNYGGEINNYNTIDSGILNVLKEFQNINTTKAYEPDHFGNSIDESFNYISKNRDKFNKIIIIGHSLGGDNAINLVNELNNEGIKVDLLVTLDIKSFYENDTITENVTNAYNFYQNTDESHNIFGINILNGEDIEPALFNNTSNIHNKLINQYNGNKVTHTNIDDLLSKNITTLIKKN